MSVGFAGSKGVDDRRRRRLAQENDKTISNDVISEKSTTPENRNSKSEQISARKRLRRHFPLRKLISHRKWKIGTAVCLAIGCSILIVLSGFYSEWMTSHLGIGFSNFVNPLSGKLAIAAAGCWLMLSGQLALLIWWVRSNSLNDFEGKYRIWPYAALAMFITAFAIMTDAHHATSALFQFLFSISFWKQGVITWLAPSLAVSFSLLAGLHRDMRDCRTSHALLWLSACGAATAAFLSLELVLPYNLPQPALVQISLMLISTASLFSGMLFHARYVIHESADAPQQRTSFLTIVGKRLFSQRKRVKKPVEAKTTTRKKKRSVAKPVSPKKKPTRKRAIPETKLTPQPSIPEPPPTTSVAKQQEEISFEPVDPDSLKGLSKKERRKLRKQAREQQRTDKRSA